MEECQEVKLNNSFLLPLGEADRPAMVQIFKALEPLAEAWSGIKLVVWCSIILWSYI